MPNPYPYSTWNQIEKFWADLRETELFFFAIVHIESFFDLGMVKNQIKSLNCSFLLC